MKAILSVLAIVLVVGNLSANDPEKSIVVKPQIENLDEVISHFTYPLAARKNGIEGCVKVQFTVNENGDLLKSKVVSACDPLMKSAIEEVLDQFKFSPAKIDGKSVAGMVTVPFKFTLKVD